MVTGGSGWWVREGSLRCPVSRLRFQAQDWPADNPARTQGAGESSSRDPGPAAAMLSLLRSLRAPPKPEAAGPFVEAAPQRAWKPLSLRPDLLLFCLMNTPPGWASASTSIKGNAGHAVTWYSRHALVAAMIITVGHPYLFKTLPSAQGSPCFCALGFVLPLPLTPSLGPSPAAGLANGRAPTAPGLPG